MRALFRAGVAACALVAGSLPAAAQNYDGTAIIKFGAFGQYGSIGVSETAPAAASSTRDDFQGGLSAGMDFRLPYRLLLGVEIDASMGDSRNFVAGTDYGLDYIFNARGRFGFYVHPDWLLYAAAGVSWLGFEAQQQGVGDFKASETVGGWTVGAGIEYEWHHVLLFGEYLHAEYGARPFTLGIVRHEADLDADIFRLGIKFKVGHDHHHWGRYYEPSPLK